MKQMLECVEKCIKFSIYCIASYCSYFLIFEIDVSSSTYIVMIIIIVELLQLNSHITYFMEINLDTFYTIQIVMMVNYIS